MTGTLMKTTAKAMAIAIAIAIAIAMAMAMAMAMIASAGLTMRNFKKKFTNFIVLV